MKGKKMLLAVGTLILLVIVFSSCSQEKNSSAEKSSPPAPQDNTPRLSMEEKIIHDLPYKHTGIFLFCEDCPPVLEKGYLEIGKPLPEKLRYMELKIKQENQFSILSIGQRDPFFIVYLEENINLVEFACYPKKGRYYYLDEGTPFPVKRIPVAGPTYIPYYILKPDPPPPEGSVCGIRLRRYFAETPYINYVPLIEY